jgi:hypothetical protein
MPLLGNSRVDQAGAQSAYATVLRPLPPAAPLLPISRYRLEDFQPAAPPPNGSSFPSTPRFALVTVRRTPRCISSIHLSFNALRSSRPSRETSSPASQINKILLSIRDCIRTTFKLLTLFFPFPSFYERQAPFPFPFPPVPAPITNDKFSIANSQSILPRTDAEFAEKKGKMMAFSAPSATLREPAFLDSLRPQKSSKTPAIADNCDPLPPLAHGSFVTVANPLQVRSPLACLGGSARAIPPLLKAVAKRRRCW